MAAPTPHAVRLTVRDLMARWGKCERSIYNLRARGLRHMKIGGHRLYRLEDVEAFEAACMARAPRAARKVA